jgi:hypothetical protein
MGGTRETRKERVDRELLELLNELRVALPGVQFLFAFLLIVPFQQTRDELTDFHKDLYFVALLAAAIAVMAFVISLATGDPADMIWFGLVAVAVLLYAYPRRGAWQRVLRMMADDDAPGARPAKGTTA